jgi:hypothetical protein
LSITEAIDPAHPLAGVRAKLARAQEHLDELNRGITAFMEREPYFVSYERKPDGSDHVFRAHVREPAPLELGVIVGDCLQNARAALDHLVWQLAILSGKAAPNGQTAFPVCDTIAFFRSKRQRVKVADLTKEYRAAIEWLQPFQIGGAAKDHWLWHLNELARIDRHRVLHIIGGIPDGPLFSTHPVDKSVDPVPYRLGKLDQSVTMDIRFSYRTFEDGAPVASWTFDPPRPDVEMKGEFTFAVALGEGVGPPARPVTDVLSNILRHIEGDVLPSVDHFFEQP